LQSKTPSPTKEYHLTTFLSHQPLKTRYKYELEFMTWDITPLNPRLRLHSHRNHQPKMAQSPRPSLDALLATISLEPIPASAMFEKMKRSPCIQKEERTYELFVMSQRAINRPGNSKTHLELPILSPSVNFSWNIGCL
jgi:hypothetical protein